MSKAANIEIINKKLQQEEEWLKQFESNVKKSAQMTKSIVETIDKLHDRITSLEQNVLPMHEVNGKLQLKQHNIQRLINTIDATTQFYGRTSELENNIRDGAPSLNMTAYLEKMELLQQAIKFFESQTNYQKKSENMKLTLDTGFQVLEMEYRNTLLRNTVPADSAALIDSLDENYELMGSHVRDVKTMKNLDEVVQLGVWLFNAGRTKFLGTYSEIRGKNMMSAINAVSNHHQMLTAKLHSKSAVLKTALKRAGKGDKNDKKDVDLGGHAEEGALLMFGCLLALLEVEDNYMQKAIPDTSQRAQVFREIVSKPLAFVVNHVNRVVEDSRAGVIPLLPLVRFLSTHQTRLQNLATNSAENIRFDQLVNKTLMKSSTCINAFVTNLREDVDKFVPIDGNVHPLTPNTLNFLVTLTLHRLTVTQNVLSVTAAKGENQSLLLPKLFAKILSALGTSLTRKADNYDDRALGQIFLLNNYNYIAKALTDEEDALLPVISEQNTQILSFYKGEIAKYIQQYMNSWTSVVTALQGAERVGNDRMAAKSIATAFAREFDAVCASQRNYCISDPKLADEVRERVRRTLMPSYSIVVEKLRDSASQLKYNEESLNTVIERLFDAIG